MNDLPDSVEALTAAYREGRITREQVADWLRRRARTEDPAAPTAAVAHGVPGKPTAIALADPQQMAQRLTAGTPLPPRPTVALDPLPTSGVAQAAASATWQADLADHGDGVLELQLQLAPAPDGFASASEACAHGIAHAAARAGAKVVVLAGDVLVSQTPALAACARDGALPVVAVVPEPAPAGAAEFDFASPSRPAALERARELAQAPAAALRLLKPHLAQQAREATPEPAAQRHGAWSAALQDALAATADDAADLGTPQRVDLPGDTVTLDEYPCGVALVTMAERRGKNTFTPELIQGLADAFAAVRARAHSRAVVLTGYDGYFACGGTKDSLLAIQSGQARFTDIGTYSLPLEAPVPVIAAMQGHAIGAGWSLGTFCDFAFFSRKHTYVSPYIGFGFTPGAGATLAFPWRLGRALAWEILFTGREYTGADLAQRGMPFPALAPADVLPRALALARRLADGPREHALALKRDAAAGLLQRLPQTLAREEAMHRACFAGNPEVLERIRQRFNDGIPMDTPNPTPETAAAPAAPSAADVHGTLRELLAAELLLEPAEIDDDQKFIDVGLDSITGVNWVRRINERFGIDLNATAVYGHPTLREFVQHVAQKLALAAPAAAAPVAAPVPAPVPVTAKAPPRAQPVPVAVKAPVPAPPVPAAKAAPANANAPEPTPARAGGPVPAARPRDAAWPQIAVVGMSGRFPLAPTLDAFWHNIDTARDCIREIPPERWDAAALYDAEADAPGKSNSRWMGVLDDVGAFDPLFFNISPREAEWMDPQQRLFLETAWHCFEDAGYGPRALAGSRCGVFVGCTAGDYSQAIRREDLNAQNFMGRAISILAAKIAYLMDLQGPCLSIDTACSSSLVALAAACDSLALGTSDLALAGGVCVLAGPDMHIMTSKAGMLSADGHCFSFDQRANGFVPGEGVGAVLLKRLEDAQRDGDAIHGVIAGWGVNQDGKTNGITAPNPLSQARLEQEVYRRHGIHPETLQLIEAHGTGTRLGDPIEVEGLKTAFGAFTQRSNFCALGSVKGNVGHLLAAAGIAGVIKLLLALKHRRLPPAAAFERRNELIALDGTPFYINTESRPWPEPPTGARRGAVSSFGFSGTNAHVVLQEAPAPAPLAAAAPGLRPQAVVLSARTPERLRQAAGHLHDFLAAPAQAGLRLQDVAHTLQVGREEMEERLAIEAHTVDELRARLQDFAAGRSGPGMHAGRVRRGDETVALFSGSRDLHQTLLDGARTGQPGPLLDLWVRGLAVDWNALRGADDVRRVHLPGYPFEHRHYWLPTPQAGSEAAPPVAAPAAWLHPLLQRDTSTPEAGTRYTSQFRGDEFFFDQHVIQGRKVLPGVGHLEMVRAAARQAGGPQAAARRLRLQNVVWLRPIACGDDGITVHVGLTPEDGGVYAFRIWSGAETPDNGAVVHSQGAVAFEAPEVAPAALPAFDLPALQAQCARARVDAHHHFEAMKTRGADLGRGFRGIDTYHLGADTSGQPQVLAHITIPDGLSHAPDRFVLHPTPMDAAVHTAPPLMAGWEQAERIRLALPFALDELEVLERCQPEMWALARPTAGASGRTDATKYDIDLCDAAGRVCVRFKGFAFRTVDKAAAASAARPDAPASVLLLQPAWEPLAAAVPAPAAPDERTVFVCGLGRAEDFAGGLGAVHPVWLPAPSGEAGAEVFTQAAQRVFRTVQALVQSRRRALVQVACAPGLAEALAGLARTLARESRLVRLQVIPFAPSTRPDAIAVLLDQAATAFDAPHLRHHDGRWQARGWQDLATRDNAPLPWKEGGVYLITGGAGALGRLFVAEIARLVERATIVLTGRSPADAALQSQLDALRRQARRPDGLQLAYRPADLATPGHAEALVREVLAAHGRIDGVLHAAGLTRDGFIAIKDEADLATVLAPKVHGTATLARALQSQCAPDFVVLFSSIASAVGNAGQADYAMANAFLDASAGAQPASRTRWLSVNWPLWADGGMRIDAATEQWMRDNTGMVPMRTAAGVDALCRALATPAAQVLVLQGDAPRMRQWLRGDDTPAHEAPPAAAAAAPETSPMPAASAPQPTAPNAAPNAAPGGSFDAALAALRPVVARILKIGAADIDLDKELISYGFDSITLTELTNGLNKQYRLPAARALNPTVFFEHPTLRSFAGFLAANCPEVGAATAAPMPAVAATAAVAAHAPVPAPAAPARATPLLPAVTPRRAAEREPIAVIGMSGRFPMARDLHEYWRNLSAGRDCISEVPADRWDWRALFGDPAQEGNRTDVKWGGFIEGVKEFDPLFFGISPREALLMDPMQRLLMQHLWLAVEDAGYSARSVSGTRTAIIVGTSVSEYGMLLAQAGVACDAFLPTGRSASLGANRMSYLLNFSGPSETVDTACSSSLVAIHRAVAAMESGQCDMALVGGVNVLIAPDGHIAFRKAGMLSVDGRCKTFSAQADGYARGEGVGTLFLKRLADAERDGDHIYGLVRGSGENHGGRASSLTAPNPKAQADLLKSVYSAAGIDPRSVGYVEAHGTGTPLGDPVEVNGLKLAFRDLYQAGGDATVTAAHCGLGSAKSNIGHLELAAGIGGAIKVLLQLQHRTLAKSLHSDALNPYIQLQGTPFYVVRETQPWPALHDASGQPLPRRAGVSSFGFGGANAHVVFEEYLPPPATEATTPGTAQLFVLSARNGARLKEMAQRLLQAVDPQAGWTEADLRHIAYTLQVGREPMEERLAFQAASLDELRGRLQAFVNGDSVDGLQQARVQRNDPALALFDADELAEALPRWLARQQLDKLLTLWVKGGDIDWRQLHAGLPQPRRVSLPGYPFAREVHWPAAVPSPTPTTPTAPTTPAPAGPAGPAAARTAWLHKAWVEQPAPTATATLADVAAPVLVLATDTVLAAARRLAAAFPLAHLVNLSDSDAAMRELARLDGAVAAWAGCIDLAGCGPDAPPLAPVIGPLQRMIARAPSQGTPLRLLALTRGLEATPPAHIGGATRAGLYRMLQSEYGKLRSRHVDVDADLDDMALVQVGIAEWLAADEPAAVRHHGGRRRVAVLQEFPAPAAQPLPPFAPEQVLWITGGTRGIGLLCADHFVRRHGVRKLVLCGREPLPARDRWDALLAGSPEPALAARLRTLQALEAQGAQVMTLALPLADAAAVQAAVRQAVQALGPIGGLLHCAGRLDRDDPAFVRKTEAGFAAVLEPKVEGTDTLLAALRGQPLRFAVLFSSVSAAVPSLAAGQSDYVAANSHLDATARALAATLPIVSVQWPSWRDTGMGEATTAAYRRTGLLSHSDAQGLQFLDAVIAAPRGALGPVVMPARVDPALWPPARLAQRTLEPATAPAAPSATPPAPPTSAATAAPGTEPVIAWLSGLFAKELMVAPASLDRDVPFQDYGVDSIMLAQILRRVGDALRAGGLDEALDPSVFYEHPTLAAFAAWLGSHHGQAVAQVVGTGAAPAAPTAASVPAPMSPPAPVPQPAPAATPEAAQAPAGTPAVAARQDIAVVGLACRFPGAADVDAFWHLLSEGRSAIGPVPAERWGHATHHHAGLLDNVTDFDPAHFLIPEEDARAMDPQALLLLEEGLNALHHAGYTAQDVKGSATGVYIGARSQHRPPQDALARARNPIVTVGQNYLAANLSQYLDLRGPSLVLDTACSSALVGMQMAVQALRAGEIGCALVGGISVLHDDAAHQLFEQRHLLAPEGRFHVMDGRAAGVVLGEGVGVVVLKTLAQAQADGDRIYAVLKALAVNNDGRTAGPATPNLVAQKAVMQQALAASGHRADEIEYIHVNGSGSEVTDLLELKAMEAVYRPQGGGARVPCELGSMEPNIGHPLCAKGMAAFCQVVLMLWHGRRVPFLSGQQPMPHYDLAASPFHFGRTSSMWPSATPLAALNCFADGGTNVHAILQAWQEPATRTARRQPLPPPALERHRVLGPVPNPAPTDTPVDTPADAPVDLPAAWPAAEPGRALPLRLGVDHPILTDHKAYGQELLPGLAYIDILFQHFERQGHALDRLELRNLSIYQPLIVAPGVDVLLDIACEGGPEGPWQVKLEGRERRADGLSEPRRYAVAEMRLQAPAAFDATLDIAAVRAGAQRTLALDDLYAQCRSQGLEHAGVIKAQGLVHEGEDATCIEIALGPLALAGAAAYRIHPALIDGSSVGAQRLFSRFFEGEQRLILPLFYESFRASSPLPERCVTRIPVASLRRRNELLYLDLEFFDTAGRQVAALRNFACKLVRDEGAINPGRRAAAATTPAPAPLPAAAPVQAAALVVPDAALAATGGQQPVERYLVELMAQRLKQSPDQIDVDLGYYELGLDSARLLELVGALESRIGASLAPTLLFEYTTIAELATYLAERYPQAWADAGPPAAAAEPAPMPAAPPTAVAAAPQAAPARAATEDEDIAIVGLAGRYPGAATLDAFWQNLVQGKDCITEVPAARWERSRLAGVKSPSGKEMSRWGGFIDDPDCFDAQFFRVSPWEARLLDPQQRLFLEVCWEAIEDAGYTPRTLAAPRGRHQRRDVGVYVGVMHNDYAILTADAIARGEPMPVSLNYAQIANRVSYFCNFHGPSMAIDTVCSSSLIAVHLAVQSLRRGESEVALAGGVNLSVHPVKYLTYGLMDMHASDGRCRTFGKGGDGYVSGEGIGCVVLKPLSHAIRDNDHVYGVIKGSTTNHVGTVSGLTVPSPVAQADMIESCLDETGIDPRTISYVEAHGTGTSLGDPIEIQGLVKAFGRYTPDRQFCAIGSVKSNIGHAESAAGISGLTKLALQLQHGMLVPSLHSAEINPYLDFAASPFYVQQRAEPWQRPQIGTQTLPRRAALSSFGASGSNAHVILEEYVAPQRSAAGPQGPLVVPLSARKLDRLVAASQRLLDWLDGAGADVAWGDIAYTLQVGREPMDERLAIIASDRGSLASGLRDFLEGRRGSFARGTVAKGRKPTFAPEDDPQRQQAQWAAEGRADRLAAAWVQGGVIDWEAIRPASCGDFVPRRVSLPTYPFAKERHWIEPAPVAAPAMVAPTPAAAALERPVAPAADPLDTVYFAPRWLARPLDPQAGPAARRATVLLLGSTAQAATLAAALPSTVGVQALAPTGDVVADLQAQLQHLVALCQAPDRIRRTERELLLVWAPLDSDEPQARALMGALRTITLELPAVRTRLALDAALAAGDLAASAARLRAEIEHDDGATELRYRHDGTREALVHQRLQPAAAAPSLAAVARAGGVYLITGGLGGLGLMFARHLGAGTGARIVLTGRSALDAGRHAALQALRDLGVTVEYRPCDSAQPADVQRLVQEVLAAHGALHGVIHSAGVLRDNFIPRKTPAELAEVLAAKVPAIVNLDAATARLPLDFFVAFSSMASLGNPGQVDYATANAFLDVFMARRALQAGRGERSGRSLSMGWPLWTGGGMTVQPAYEALMRERYGIEPLDEAHGVPALAAALALPDAQVGVLRGDGTRIERLLAVPAPAGARRGGIATAAPAAGIEAAVRDAVAQALGMQPGDVDPEVAFADYGMDSIGATKIANHLNERLGLDLTGAIFLELDSAARLLAHLTEVMGASAEAAPAPVAEAEAMAAFTAATAVATAVTMAPSVATPMTAATPEAARPPAGPPRFSRVAVVGYDLRVADAEDAETFWRNLVDKRISTRPVPAAQWDERGVARPGDAPSMRHAALLDRVDTFDAAFWDLPEPAAREMDPQERLLLKSIWRCAEHAGYAMKELTRQRVGLFLALDSTDYQSVLQASGTASGAPALSTGMIANQISYLCNFKGPSEAIDTACASTYVALRRAAQALAWGECDVAIVGGAKVLLDPAGFAGREEGEILGAGPCMYPFDSRAAGYLRGEGVGCVLLKGLDAAQRDGDRIRGVVAGIGITHNGRGGLSQVAPSVEGQALAIAEAFRSGGIAADSVNYIEAHGTSNSFSDASEVAAFKQYFRQALPPEVYARQRIAVSTVKANIGHLEGASGIAALVKALCALRDGRIAPIATWNQVHPSILLARSPFHFAADVEDWPRLPAAGDGTAAPRRMGLHSIGIGGVNAHVILEEAPPLVAAPAAPRAGGPQVVLVSARTARGLDEALRQWRQQVLALPQDGQAGARALAALAAASQLTRDAQHCRAAFVVHDLPALAQALALGADRLARQPMDTPAVWAAAQADERAGARTEVLVLPEAPAPVQWREAAAAWLQGRTVAWPNWPRAALPAVPGHPFQEQRLWCTAAPDPFAALFYETFPSTGTTAHGALA